MEKFRRAYGALKDSTKVGLAKVNSDFKDLDIAIVKATNHVEAPPKERHVRKIFVAISISRPRADVGYCIHALSRRLSKTRNWIVAIKALIVIHRTLREADSSFREELVHYSRRGNLFQMSNFKDDSSALAWDCSAWIRTYALYLEERVECIRSLNFDIESDKVSNRSSPGINKAYSKTRLLNNDELLEKLPALQQLLYRLVSCQPEGLACHNFLVQYALALVVKESFKVYCAINDGIINLVDTYFEMPKYDAVRALEIYKKASHQADYLADFYGFCRTLDLARTFQFPILRQPPPSFLATMEEYIKEASIKRLEDQEPKEELQKLEAAPQEIEKPVEEIKNEQEIIELVEEEQPLPVIIQEEIPQPPTDLLGLNEVNPKAIELEERNALALAIVRPGNEAFSCNNALAEIGKTSGWELALVTAPSNTNRPQVAEPNMAGGFNKLLLDSLYEDNTSRRQLELQRAGYTTNYGFDPHNPFNVQQSSNNNYDPFAMSNSIAPPTNVQMAMLSQQEQMMMMQQQQHQMMTTMQYQQQMGTNMSMVPYNPYNNNSSQYYQQQQNLGYSNPFGDAFAYPQNGMGPYANNNHHALL